MKRRRNLAKLGGFSLLELAVTLAIIGRDRHRVLAVFAAHQESTGNCQTDCSDTRQCRERLNGFILANSRLPCPDTTGTGVEDCSVTAGVPIPIIGWLPYKTLGVGLSERVRYGVYRAPFVAPASVTTDGDLAALKDRYQPLLPPASRHTIERTRTFASGCAILPRRPARSSGQTSFAGASTQAYRSHTGLAVAGADDADHDGSRFDGLNVVPENLPRPARHAAPPMTTGPPRSALPNCYPRLGCASRLADATARARAAFAAYDIDQFAQRICQLPYLCHSSAGHERGLWPMWTSS